MLLDVWNGWHKIARPMKKHYVRYVELANKGAQELGFKDAGAMWRAKYDMSPDEFAKELDRLWEQVKPLVHLASRVRSQQADEQYGERVANPNGPIPAHLLGNMWAQSWENIYPDPRAAERGPGLRPDRDSEAQKTDAKEMVRYGERFFTSLGFDPLPKTFWERSLFVKPRDREVVCHASAWDVDYVDDLRIKMCIDITGGRLQHHSSRARAQLLPACLQQSALPFPRQRQRRIPRGDRRYHRALRHAGVSGQDRPARQNAPDASKDIGLLLNKALEKVAFLPFGL